MSMNLNERLAVVETQIEQIIESSDRREEKQDAILEELKETKEALAKIEGELQRYKGFLGGIAFVVSCIGVFFYKIFTPLMHYINSKGM